MVLGCLAVGGAAATAGIIGTGDILGITTVVAGITTVVAGMVVAGMVVAGMAVAGMAVAGMAVVGTAVAGTAVAGMAVAGMAVAGMAVAGTAVAGMAVAGTAVAGMAVAGKGGGGGHHSDIRLKEDIVPLARLDNGIELYRFRYKGRDHTAYVGVMAQEVQEIEPSAVWRDRDGYLVVNYDRLGLKFMTWDEWLARISTNYQSAH